MAKNAFTSGSTSGTSPVGGRVISVGGGKGGVGKSVLAANLAVAIAQSGRRVVLVDLDLGAPSQHLLLGVESRRPGIRPLIAETGTTDDVAAALTPTGIPDLSLLGGSDVVLGAAKLTSAARLRLLRKLRALDAVVVLDVGADVGGYALDFFLLGGQRLVVTTPHVTAIHDAYSFLKGAVLRLLGQQAERSAEAAALEPALLLRSFNAYLVGNQVSEHADAKVLPSVAKMMHDFLGIEVPILGWIAAGAAVSESVDDRRPFMLDRASEQSRAVRQFADALLAEEITDERDPDVAPAKTPPPPPTKAPPPPPGRPLVPMRRIELPVGRDAVEGTTKTPRRRPVTLPGMTPFRRD